MKFLFLVLLLVACGKNIPEQQVQPNCEPAPVANAGLPQLIVKEGSALKLPTQAKIGVSAIAGQVYSWSPTEGLTSPGEAETLAKPSKTTLYTVTATNKCGWQKASVLVSVYSE